MARRGAAGSLTRVKLLRMLLRALRTDVAAARGWKRAGLRSAATDVPA